MSKKPGAAWLSDPILMTAILGPLVVAAFLLTKLGLHPVPWPDVTAYYIPGYELLGWPPSWRMHPQAAFVESYDRANFNTLPGYAALLGLLGRAGFTHLVGVHFSLRFVSLACLLALAAVLAAGLRDSGRRALPLLLFGLVVSNPVLRWGTLGVRTEVWILLFWVLILEEARKGIALRPWRVGLLLSAAAYFHYAAIILVPGTALALWPGAAGAGRGERLRLWIAGNLRVAAATLAFLGPWLAYAFVYRVEFLEQLTIHFDRLPSIRFSTLSWSDRILAIWDMLTWRLFFYPWSPAQAPPATWILIGLYYLLLGLLAADLLARLKAKRAAGRGGGQLVLGACATHFASVALWLLKPEYWFVTLVHGCGLIWLAHVLRDRLPGPKDAGPWTLLPRALDHAPAVLFVTIAVSLGINASLYLRTDDSFSWRNYYGWVRCIESEIASALGPDRPLRIWQPHPPDVLAELHRRHPGWDFTRTLDIASLEQAAWEFGRTRADGIIFARSGHLAADGGLEGYRGPPRPGDEPLLRGRKFGDMAFQGLRLDPASEWTSAVCHVGPFWAQLYLRSRRQD